MKVSDKRFRGAILRILRPFARLLIRCGVSYPEFDALAKAAFVETATIDYGKRGRPANVSRVASIVGLSRKEVARIRDVGIAGAWYPETHMSPINRVIHHWLHDKEFAHTPNRPKAIPLTGPGSFEILIKQYAGDLPIGAVRSELEQRDALTVDEKGQCELQVRFLKFTEDKEDLVHGILFNVRNLLETVEYNFRLIASGPQARESSENLLRFERSVWNNQLSEEGAQAFNTWLEERGQAFLEEANGFISEREVAVGGENSRERVIGVGMYFYDQDS